MVSIKNLTTDERKIIHSCVTSSLYNSPNEEEKSHLHSILEKIESSAISRFKVRRTKAEIASGLTLSQKKENVNQLREVKKDGPI